MANDLTGSTLGKYQIMERLGRGGMADVYRAYQPGMDRYVAVKVMHGHLATDPSFITRFKREAQSVGNLRHPNIVQVIDFDVQNDEYYMVMEYIEGDSLKAMLQRRGALPVDDALDIAIKLADALAYAHGEGMIHRDIKPANVMLAKSGKPILTDFGIARIINASGLTVSGAFVGTPSYVSPEAGRGEQVDERADIYSLGIVLYEMLTGKVPYDADTPYAVILKHINDPLPLPRQLGATLPGVVERVVLTALAKTKEDRFQTAAAFRDALIQAKAEAPHEEPTAVGLSAAGTQPAVPTEQAHATVPATTPTRRNPAVLAAAGVIGLILILGALYAFANRGTPPLPDSTATAVAVLSTQTTAAEAVLTAAPTVTQTVVPSTVPSAVPTTEPTPAAIATNTATNAAVAPSASKYAKLIEQVQPLLINGDHERALGLVEEALKADPQSYDLLVLRGRVYAEGPVENRGKAEADAQVALKLDANRPEAYVLLGVYNQIGKQTDKGDEVVANQRQAIAYFTQAIDKGSQDYYAYWGRARANETISGYIGTDNAAPASAIQQDYEAAARLTQHDARLYLDRGRFYGYQANYPAAQKSYEQVLAIWPDAYYVYVDLGVVLLLQEQKQKPYDLYVDAIENKKAHDPEFLAEGAYLAWLNGKVDKATEWAKLALALEPNTPAALYVLALIDWDAKRYDDALKKGEAIMKMADPARYAIPFLTRRFNRHLLADRARIYADMGKLDEAISAYNDALQDEPYWITLLVEQAKVYMRQNKLQEARTNLRTALDYALSQNDTQARDMILALLKDMGGTEVPAADSSETPAATSAR
ncbi:MAG: protein kinase [Anaerolineae bacterium]|nr:protein kinase [Anaerolineae bacterium]